MEIIKQVREKLGPEMIVGIKINSSDFQKGGLTEEECTEVLKELDANPLLDFVELSGGSFENPKVMESAEVKASTLAREGFFIEFAGKMSKTITKIPVMVTGGMRSREGMNRALEEGISIVGVARPFCLDPNWPKQMLAGEIDRVKDKAMDPKYNIPFYTVQIDRLGKGLHPDLDLDLSLPAKE